jgi:hypothetical protein
MGQNVSAQGDSVKNDPFMVRLLAVFYGKWPKALYPILYEMRGFGIIDPT